MEETPKAPKELTKLREDAVEAADTEAGDATADGEATDATGDAAEATADDVIVDGGKAGATTATADKSTNVEVFSSDPFVEQFIVTLIVVLFLVLFCMLN